MGALAGAVLQAGGTLCVSLLFPLLRWVLHTNVFEPLAVAALQPVWQASDSKVTPERMQLAVEKFCESLWKLLVYASFFGIGLVAVWRQPWLLDTWQLWDGWPDQPSTPPMQLLYNLELGFYIASVFMIVAWEIRRKDFAAMFGHHVATVLLISTSMYFGFWRAGVVVMLLHDANDVLMEAAKLAKYGGKEEASVGLFAVFVVAWLLLRLVAFPLMVVRSTLLELPGALGGRPPTYFFFNALLLGLLALHCYWFTLILRVAWLAVTTGKADDVREDDD